MLTFTVLIFENKAHRNILHFYRSAFPFKLHTLSESSLIVVLMMCRIIYNLLVYAISANVAPI